MDLVLFGAEPIYSPADHTVPKPAFPAVLSFAKKVELYTRTIDTWRYAVFTLVGSGFY